MGTVEPANQNQYTYTHLLSKDLLHAPVIYYRLKITDANGKYNYSAVIAVKFNTITNELKVFPTIIPSTTTVQLQALENAVYTFNITDIAGRVVRTSRIIW